MQKQFTGGLGLTLAMGFLLALTSCSSTVKPKEEKKAAALIDPATLVGPESKMLLDYLTELGDYVNTRVFPSLIKPASVYEGLGDKQLIVDIREPEVYEKGHIKGATNIPFKHIPSYFESDIVPFEFDKIIVVSADGQRSSYATCLLRLMGYGNVYSMRWGMSAWSNDFAQDSWQKALGSEYQDQLETKVNNKNPARALPDLQTGKTTGEEILLDRISQLFAEGIENTRISAQDAFAANNDFYIMNYIRSDKYNAGHIPGAVRYKPQATLGIVSEMVTIPADKKVIVYCGTGHNSEFVTAYLRLFGYDAKTLSYGNNSFMYDKMVAERKTLSWLPFSNEEIKDYPYQK